MLIEPVKRQINNLEYKIELGEGVYFDNQKNILYWVDINNETLYRYTGDRTHSYRLNYKVSAVLEVKNNEIYLSSEVGIICYNLDSKKISTISLMPIEYSHEGYRSNDAIKISKELYMYGVMRKIPLQHDGGLILSQNGCSIVLYKGIAIPNTFIRIPGTNSLLISDSFEQITYKFDFNSAWNEVLNQKVWLDLSGTTMTPDGGCISSNGKIFLAIWNGYKVLELNLTGNIINEFKLPFPRPTSCALNTEENRLFVTSAYEGLSDIERKKYPLSGAVFEINIESV